jgi:hypothetical protein
MLFPAPAAKSEKELMAVKADIVGEAYDFHGSIIVIRSSSILGMCSLG